MQKPNRRPYLAAVVLGTALVAAQDSAQAAIPTRTIGDISRYCAACWRNARLPVDRWSDCTQEVLCRLLQRVPAPAWDRLLASDGDERREFIRAIDAVKKRTQRERHRGALPEFDLADRRDLHERVRAEDRERLVQAAAEVLSPRQQRIIQLSWEGASIPDIAQEMEMPPQRVSDEKYKAIQRLRGYFDERTNG
jgi:RNA polymerase sigma factor (sigma-70 family)